MEIYATAMQSVWPLLDGGWNEGEKGVREFVDDVFAINTGIMT